MGGTRYQVGVCDNFHLFDESHVGNAGTFDDLQSAIAAAQRIIIEGLEAGSAHTADDTYRNWAAFGDSPFIVASDASKVEFSACEYARQQAEVIAARE